MGDPEEWRYPDGWLDSREKRICIAVVVYFVIQVLGAIVALVGILL